MHKNPFFIGTPVPDEQFIGRGREFKRVIGRIQKGESSAVIGDPHIGKSSFLKYLLKKGSDNLNRDDGGQWHFFMIDTHNILGSGFTPKQFWEHALSPIQEQIEAGAAPSAIADHYQICKTNNFGNITLERFFAQLKKAGWHFVLLIDEFDALLHHPVLNSAEFYGGLRALASCSGDAFALVIASRAKLSRLNAITQEFNPTGSPFFNIFREVELGPFTEKDVKQLLNLAGDQLDPHDRDGVRILGGCHPYLLQAAAGVMWEAMKDGNINRLSYVTQTLYREADHFFSDSWQNWPPELRKAFTVVGIVHQAYVMEGKFKLSKLIKDLEQLGPELSDLEARGMIAKNSTYHTGYCVEPEIMLTWLADEVVKAVRSDQPFETWLQDREMAGAFLTKTEKETFKKIIQYGGGLLKQGAGGLIQALIKKI